MKRSRYSEERIVAVLKEAEAGVPVSTFLPGGGPHTARISKDGEEHCRAEWHISSATERLTVRVADEKLLLNKSPRFEEFFKLATNEQRNFRIGFDTCTITGLARFGHAPEISLYFAV